MFLLYMIIEFWNKKVVPPGLKIFAFVSQNFSGGKNVGEILNENLYSDNKRKDNM